MAVTIGRTPWIDDDGTGTTGTILNNAVKTALYNEIDAALAQLLAGNEAWVDFSALSTIIGWSSFSVKKLQYMKLGKLIFVAFDLNGTSNSGSTSFTVPEAADPAMNLFAVGLAFDNGAALTTVTRIDIPGGSAVVALQKDAGNNAWTASGLKIVRGQFFYRAA